MNIYALNTSSSPTHLL